MTDKIEVLSNEFIEINNVIALAKADSEVKQILLSEMARELDIDNEELKQEKQLLFFEEQTHEVINLAKATPQRLCFFLCAVVQDDKMSRWLTQYYADYFGSQGEMRA